MIFCAVVFVIAGIIAMGAMRGMEDSLLPILLFVPALIVCVAALIFGFLMLSHGGPIWFPWQS